MAKISLRAVMRTAAEYRESLGHSAAAALREAWAYHRSTRPKTKKRQR